MMQRKAELGVRAIGIAGALFAGACVMLCGTAYAQSQTTAYIRIVTSRGPIEGTATDPGHRGWIPCREASAPSVSEITAANAKIVASGPTRKATSPAVRGTAAGEAPRDAATGQASGKRRWAPLRIIKEIDVASPKLLELANSGQSIPEVDVELIRNEGGKMVPAAKYKLTNAIVSGVQKMSSGGDRPSESVTFTFEKIEIQH